MPKTHRQYDGEPRSNTLEFYRSSTLSKKKRLAREPTCSASYFPGNLKLLEQVSNPLQKWRPVRDSNPNSTVSKFLYLTYYELITNFYFLPEMAKNSRFEPSFCHALSCSFRNWRAPHNFYYLLPATFRNSYI